MADGDGFPPPIRLMNFVSQEQLEEAKRNRGARVEDGTAQRDRPLFEILKENKDKKDAEFNERFKHRPPKALDEDETEFLDNLEMSRKEYEQKMADDEAQELRSFQAAVAAQSTLVQGLLETSPVPKPQEEKLIGKKKPPARSLGMIIKVKPQAKKAKVEQAKSDKYVEEGVETPNTDAGKAANQVKTAKEVSDASSNAAGATGTCGLVSYSDESDEE